MSLVHADELVRLVRDQTDFQGLPIALVMAQVDLSDAKIHKIIIHKSVMHRHVFGRGPLLFVSCVGRGWLGARTR